MFLREVLKGVFFKTSFKITFLSLINVILNFCVQLFTAYLFGTSVERDVYFASIVVPTYITATIVGSVNVIFLPQLVSSKNSVSKRLSFLSGAIYSYFLGLVLICLLVYIFIHPVVDLIAPGFDVEKKQLSVELLSILVPSVLFQCLFNILTLIHNAYNRFVSPTVLQLFVPVFSFVCTAVLHNSIGIKSLAIGYTIGNVLAFIGVCPILFKLGFWLVKPEMNVMVRQWYKLAIPLILTSLISRSAQLVERIIASTLPVGTLSVIGYANQMMMVLCTIVSSGISALAFASLSNAWAKDDLNSLAHIVNTSMITILMVTFAISGIIGLFGNTLIDTVFVYGSMSEKDGSAIAYALILMLGAFVGNSIGTILVKCFYISGRTKTIAVLEIAASVFYLLVAYKLSNLYGMPGLAVSASLGSLFSISISYWTISRYIPGVIGDHLFLDLLKIFGFTIIACSLAYACEKVLSNMLGVPVLLSVGFSSILIVFLQIFLCRVFGIGLLTPLKAPL
jgi:putative peptidoglycan lipid II flippase